MISGSTNSVTNMSRRVAAASSSKGNKERSAAGEAGAWVGKLGFLDYLSEIDKRCSGALVSSLPSLSKESPSTKEPKTLSTAPSNNALASCPKARDIEFRKACNKQCNFKVYCNKSNNSLCGSCKSDETKY